MIDQSVARSGQETTTTVPEETRARVARGLKLFRERGEEIENLGRGRYSVPGCSGGTYEVSLGILGGEESCECPDFERRGTTCKHLTAATLYRAKVQRPAWLAAKAESDKRRKEPRASGEAVAVALSTVTAA